jgi:hypothetical protein
MTNTSETSPGTHCPICDKNTRTSCSKFSDAIYIDESDRYFDVWVGICIECKNPKDAETWVE